MKHILIVGYKHVGKSTLINKALDRLGKPVYGFRTKKEDDLATEELGSPVYIYDVSKPKIQTEENLIGYCKNFRSNANIEVFNTYASVLNDEIPKDSIILMDEIGFMESRAEEFCKAILHRLDGDIPVIAAVKDKENTFLDQVRNHPNCKCFFIDEKNRDELFKEVITYMNI